MGEGTTSRRFLGAVGGAGAGLVMACGAAESPRPGATPAPGPMPTRKLGRTGVTVSAFGIGGYHLGNAESEAEAIRIVHRAIDEGVTFLDNCWDYHGGKSERWMGKALEGGRRSKVFLMTKTDGHTKEACAAQIDQCLSRLRTDHLDLVQVHEVIRPTDPEKVFAEGGAIEALLEAKRAGKLRFIGFTGHKSPEIHLAMLDKARRVGFSFDTVQMPLNVLDHHFESFEKKVLPVLVREGIGVLGMKPLAAGAIPKSGAASAPECLRYALSLPTSVVITGCDSMAALEQALEVARGFSPMPGDEREALLRRTAPFARSGEHERFKTTGDFDGTEQNPRWLTTADV